MTQMRQRKQVSSVSLRERHGGNRSTIDEGDSACGVDLSEGIV